MHSWSMTDRSTASFTQAMLSLHMKFCSSSWTCLQEIEQLSTPTFCPWETAMRDQMTFVSKRPFHMHILSLLGMHTYCLNRYPDFFRGTWFLVDRLHWFNHRGCNGGYNINEYAQFSSLNSQAAEQCNSSLGKLKSMLSYMTNKNFHLHCKFYLWVLNFRKQRKADNNSY